MGSRPSLVIRIPTRLEPFTTSTIATVPGESGMPAADEACTSTWSPRRRPFQSNLNMAGGRHTRAQRPPCRVRSGPIRTAWQGGHSHQDGWKERAASASPGKNCRHRPHWRGDTGPCSTGCRSVSWARCVASGETTLVVATALSLRGGSARRTSWRRQGARRRCRSTASALAGPPRHNRRDLPCHAPLRASSRRFLRRSSTASARITKMMVPKPTNMADSFRGRRGPTRLVGGVPASDLNCTPSDGVTRNILLE